MDASIQRSLNDKVYDKRKQGALDLERVIRELVANKNHDKIQAILDQLCNEYAYAVHQPYTRNGGLIGLAAAAIALGPELPRYLEIIVPPVLACFTDQDARVRYYACEAMYNLAKVAKGEILKYFNYIFDALCKLGADSELSVKNGAELLDRLVKDIVSESAATYVSILETPPGQEAGGVEKVRDDEDFDETAPMPTAFSLPKFIPLLKDRSYTINPFTRMFLVGWITLLDSIPDLELVVYLPDFLGSLLRFLSDPNRDVHVATQGCLDRFLNEIRRISRLKKGIAESKKSKAEGKRKRVDSLDSRGSAKAPLDEEDAGGSHFAIESDTDSEDDWIPGQDVNINYKAILAILVLSLDSLAEEDGLLESLRWINEFMDICPEEVLPFTPQILANLLPAMASGIEPVRQAASRVNDSLMEYVASISEEVDNTGISRLSMPSPTEQGAGLPNTTRTSLALPTDSEGRATPLLQPRLSVETARGTTPTLPRQLQANLDYGAAVSSLTLLFLNDHEATRVAALTWLIMLHKKAPRRIPAFNDGTFPALLKTLSDPSDAVVTKDLQLLSQISRNSEEDYFHNFMISLLQLFSTDRRLLETRGNLIIRQLCVSLSAERIYRTMAECIEKDEDIEFASIMVQNLNNNLITAPELADLRKRLRNLETKDGQTFFVTLFRSWCYNAVATFSLCLLAQAYEQAYNLLQIFAELEMTVNILIQIDKLVQLLESPVFTYLRLQLLEHERYPHLFKCLYGLLMLLPQSSAFAALKNRLNSVSSIGYLHVAQRTYVPSSTPPPSPSRHGFVAGTAHVFSSNNHPLPPSPRFPPARDHNNVPSINAYTTYPCSTSTASSSTSSYDRPPRLKGREESIIRWNELLEKFRSVQDRTKKMPMFESGFEASQGISQFHVTEPMPLLKEPAISRIPGLVKDSPAPTPPAVKPKTGLGRQLGRFGGAVSGRNKK